MGDKLPNHDDTINMFKIMDFCDVTPQFGR